jgi:hypothetical protein
MALKTIELKESFCPSQPSAEVRCFADGKRISRAEYNEMTAISVWTDCFWTENIGGIRHNYKTVRFN